MLDCVAPNDFIYADQFYHIPGVCLWVPSHGNATPDNEQGKAWGLRTDPIPASGIIATTHDCAHRLIPYLGTGPYVIFCYRFGNDEMLLKRTIDAGSEKVVRWLSMQATCWYADEQAYVGSLVEHIPIGLRSGLEGEGWPLVVGKILDEPEPPIINRVFGCFGMTEEGYRHCPYRLEAREFCQTHPFVTWSEHLEFSDYLRTIRQHDFVMSPWGFGPDNFRNWEAVYLRRIPIVKRNLLHNTMTDLPIALYDDLDQITESWLDEQYVSCHAKSARRAGMSYWIERARTLLKETTT